MVATRTDASEKTPLAEAREALKEFLDESDASLTLVIDPAGRVVLAAGNPGELDPTGFASVCAAHFEANVQLATLVGEPEFRTLLHQGRESSIYLVGVADRAVLAVVYAGTRLLEEVNQEGQRVSRRLEEPIQELLLGSGEKGKTVGLGSEWVQAVENEIERVFREGV